MNRLFHEYKILRAQQIRKEKAAEPLIEVLGGDNLNPLAFSAVCKTLGNFDFRAVALLNKTIEARRDERVVGFAELSLENIQKKETKHGVKLLKIFYSLWKLFVRSL